MYKYSLFINGYEYELYATDDKDAHRQRKAVMKAEERCGVGILSWRLQKTVLVDSWEQD